MSKLDHRRGALLAPVVTRGVRDWLTGPLDSIKKKQEDDGVCRSDLPNKVKTAGVTVDIRQYRQDLQAVHSAETGGDT